MSLNIELLRSSFEKVKPMASDVADKFYEFLWSDYPGSKALFEGVDMNRQKKALLGSLVYIVDHLESEKLVPYLKSMGSRHLDYNTEPEHYDLVGASLIKTFAFFFDDEWSDELNQAWSDAYGVISSTMISGAKESVKEEKEAEKIDIREYTKKLCEELVAEVIEEELENLVKEIARPKIKQLILKTLEEESKNLLRKPLNV